MTDRRTVPTTDHRLTPAPGWHAVSVYDAGSTPLGLDPSGEELTAPVFHVHVDPLIGWATSTAHYAPPLGEEEPDREMYAHPVALAEGQFVQHAGESFKGDGSPFGGLWWTLTPSYGRAPRGSAESWEPWHSVVYGVPELAQHLGLAPGLFLIRWHEDGEPVRLLLCNAYGPSDVDVWGDDDPDTEPQALVALERLGDALAERARTEAELIALCPGMPERIVQGALRRLVAEGRAKARNRPGDARTYAAASGALS